MSSSRHLDPSGGREVVYCHSCSNEWYNDEHGLQCPRCHSDICEIVAPDSDPRDIPDSPTRDTDFSAFDSRGFGSHDHDFPDPDEDDIDDLRPPGFFMSNTQRQRDGLHQDPNFLGPRPIDPGSQEEIFQRFQETLNMLMGGMGGAMGPTGRSDRETLFGGRPGASTQTRTVHMPGGRGRTTFSITTSTIPLRAGGSRGMDHDDDFDMIFGNAMGGGNIRAPHGGNPAVEGGLQNFFSILLGPAGPNAIHGDAVYTQEALDRIITQLMESNPSSNAAPPASQTAINMLQKKKLDNEMMGDGKAECTICIDEMHLGDEVTVLPCNHWFHGECVVLWLKEHNTCPICRAPIEKRDGDGIESHDGNGEAGGSSRSQQRRASDGGPPGPLPHLGFFGGTSPPSNGTSSSYQTRGNRSPEEMERRLNAIRNLAGSPSYGQPQPEPPQYNPSRRDSWSPTSPPPGSSSARERSPTRPRPGRSNSSSWNSQWSGRSGNNSGGNGGSSNPLSWIRDRFNGSGGNSSSNNNNNNSSSSSNSNSSSRRRS